MVILADIPTNAPKPCSLLWPLPLTNYSDHRVRDIELLRLSLKKKCEVPGQLFKMLELLVICVQHP